MSQFNEEMNKKAVALSYDENINSAPVIVASGMGHMAEKIVETARESGVPVYEDNSLATMLTQLELGSEIPEQLYQAIVDIYVYFLNFATKGAAAQPESNVKKATEPETAQAETQAETNAQQPPATETAQTETSFRQPDSVMKSKFSVQEIMESQR